MYRLEIPTFLQILTSTELRDFTVVNHDSSRAPFVSMNDVLYKFATNTSTIPMSAKAYDFDGRNKRNTVFCKWTKSRGSDPSQNLR